MTTTAIRKTINPLAALPWKVTPTFELRPGDVFTTDAGTGVLVYITRTTYPNGSRIVSALDLTGRRHNDLHVGGRIHRLLDLDTLPACDTCERGCDCGRNQPACEHFACWGSVTDAVTTCPGALAQSIALYQRVAQR